MDEYITGKQDLVLLQGGLSKPYSGELSTLTQSAQDERNCVVDLLQGQLDKVDAVADLRQRAMDAFANVLRFPEVEQADFGDDTNPTEVDYTLVGGNIIDMTARRMAAVGAPAPFVDLVLEDHQTSSNPEGATVHVFPPVPTDDGPYLA